MFLCTKCFEVSITPGAKARPYLFLGSYGPCESCGRVADCRDVPSSWDWVWEPVKIKPKPKKKGQNDKSHIRKPCRR